MKKFQIPTQIPFLYVTEFAKLVQLAKFALNNQGADAIREIRLFSC